MGTFLPSLERFATHEQRFGGRDTGLETRLHPPESFYSAYHGEPGIPMARLQPHPGYGQAPSVPGAGAPDSGTERLRVVCSGRVDFARPSKGLNLDASGTLDSEGPFLSRVQEGIGSLGPRIRRLPELSLNTFQHITCHGRYWPGPRDTLDPSILGTRLYRLFG